jgi:uracil-DNA glycosylase family 4
MLSKEQIKKLTFLTSKIQKCRKCKLLHKNGMAVPYWTPHSRIMIMAESPGKDEVRKNLRTPLVGKSGRLLFRELKKKNIGLSREDFLILNTVQCRPVVNNRNGKPSIKEIETCKFWTDKYIKVFKPKFSSRKLFFKIPFK